MSGGRGVSGARLPVCFDVPVVGGEALTGTTELWVGDAKRRSRSVSPDFGVKLRLTGSTDRFRTRSPSHR